MAALCLMLAAGRADIIDRIAVTVDDRVITLSDLLQEIRVAALLDGLPAEFTADRKRQAAERLIEHHLLTRDMELTRFSFPGEAATREFLERLRISRALDASAWRAELARYGLTEAVLKEHLARRLAVLSYVEFRFRPEVQLSEEDIRQYAQEGSLSAPGSRAGPAGLSGQEARRAAEAALTAQRVDQLVDAWLKDARRRARIRYREAAFQ